VQRQLGEAAGSSSGNSFEDLILDTWDAGNKADIGTFMEAITRENCNYRTKENGWTPLMVLAGLNAKGTASAIRQVKELGGDPAIVDVEGWNSLHWAAFHGSLDAAKELVKDTALLVCKDKEGKLPVDMAKAEGNEDIAKLLERMSIADTPINTNDDPSEGLRKRK
jgi:ankyrin repeat protein